RAPHRSRLADDRQRRSRRALTRALRRCGVPADRRRTEFTPPTPIGGRAAAVASSKVSRPTLPGIAVVLRSSGGLMPRLLTNLRASRTAGVLCALAVICCARTAAADCLMDKQVLGIGFAPSGSGLAGFLINQLTNTFTLNVFINNSFVVQSNGSAGVFP